MTAAYQPRFLSGLFYGLGDAGFNLLWVLYDGFLLYFLRQIAHLPAWSLVLLLGAGRCTDLLAGIAFGFRGQSRRGRFGVYRPVLAALALPLAAAAALLFADQRSGAAAWLIQSSSTRAVLWTTAAVILFSAVYATANAAYTALLSVITPDDRVRVKLATWRFACASAGVLAVQFAFLPLVAKLGHGSEANGWQRAAFLLAVVSCVLLLTSVAGTREVMDAPAAPKTSLAPVCHALRQEPRLMALLVAMVASLAAFTVRGSVSPFYVEFVSGHRGSIGKVLTVNSAASFAICACLPALPSRWLRPDLLAMVCAAAGAVLCVMPAAVGSMTLKQLYGEQVLFGAATGALLPTLFALLAAPPDDPARRRILTPSMLAALALTGLKLGAALGTLWVSRQVSGASSLTSDAAHRMLVSAFSTLPGALLAVAFAALMLAHRAQTARRIIAETND